MPENKLDPILDTANDAIIAMSSDGNILSWNKGAENIFGYGKKEILNKGISIIIPEKLGVAQGLDITRINAEGEHHGIGKILELVGLKKDGREFPIELSLSTWEKENRVFYGGIIRDISMRKQREKEKKESDLRLHSIMQSANDAIISANEKGNILTWNQGAEKIFGFKEEEVLGKPLTVIIPKKYHEPHNHGIARVNAKGEYQAIGKTVELEGLRKDGSEFPIELSLATWNSAGNQFFSGIIRDITERKLLEQSVSEQNSSIKKLIDKLKIANEELKELDQLKDDFLANTTHELRTPMVSILGYADALLNCDVKSEQGEEFLRFIVEEGERLNLLIENILDISAITSGKLDLIIETINFDEIISRTIQTVEGILLPNRNIKIQYLQSDFLFQCDKNKIIQVLINILGNAIKHSPENGTIEILVEQREKDFTIFIKDQGQGIPADKLAVIFEKFKKIGNNPRKKKKGTGLGLTVSKGIIEAHHGKIWAESSENGALIAFTLQYKPSDICNH